MLGLRKLGLFLASLEGEEQHVWVLSEYLGVGLVGVGEAGQGSQFLCWAFNQQLGGR